jgi:hypothetical protein
MRLILPLALMALVLLTGCLADRPDAAAGDAPTVAGAIEVTPLDAPPSGAAPETPVAEPAERAATAPTPKMSAEALAEDTPATPPETEALLEEVAAPPPPPPLKSASQIACEKKGGRFAKAGNSTTFVCVRETRDGGKSCRRETDCEGLCLARSRSCSPITPVLGCQEILTQDGARVTQCVE